MINSQHKCIICSSTSTEAVHAEFVPFLNERMFDNRKQETSCIKCLHCDFTCSSYRPTEDEMTKLYKNYRDEAYQKLRNKHEVHYTAEFNTSLGDNDTRKHYVYKYISEAVDTSCIKKILDYGGNTGYYIPDEFADRERYVYDISGANPIEGIHVVSSKEELSSHQWDLILCSHVLEHVSDPISMIQEITNAMPKNSLLYIEVPYERPFEDHLKALQKKRIKRFIKQKLYNGFIFIKNLLAPPKTALQAKRYYSSIKIHEHINAFTPNTFHTIFTQMGYSIIRNFAHKKENEKYTIISCLVKKTL